MTPGLPTSPCSECSFWIFQMKRCHFFSCCLSVVCLRWCVCVCVLITTLLFLCVNTTYILVLGAQRRPWLMRLWWQRSDALRLAPMQLGPMLRCKPQGGMLGKGEVEGSGVGWRRRRWRGANRGLIVLNQLSWLRARTRLFSISFLFFSEFLSAQPQ